MLQGGGRIDSPQIELYPPYRFGREGQWLTSLERERENVLSELMVSFSNTPHCHACGALTRSRVVDAVYLLLQGTYSGSNAATSQRRADVEAEARLEAVTSHGMFAADGRQASFATRGGQDGSVYLTTSTLILPP
jgi:hypothetical protein